MTARNLMKFMTLVVSGAIAAAACIAQSRSAESTGGPGVRLERMPESLESRYATSALPPHLREGAAIYLLDPDKGYAVSRNGTNGFSCIVVRSDWQFPTRPFRDDIFWPVCFDAEGSKTLMQDYLTAAELRAQGMDAKQVHQHITSKFGTATYPNPSRVGVAFMIAPIIRTVDDTKVPEPKTMNMPHYMFYAPNVKNSDIGGKPVSQYPFILSMSPGRDDFIIVLVGEAEKAQILLEFKDLLNDLCAYRTYLCTTDATRMQLPTRTGGRQ